MRGNWLAEAAAAEASYQEIKRWDLARGRFFDDDQTEHAARVIVIGEIVRRELFPGSDPIGEIVRIRGLGFEVIGVLAPKGQSATGQDQDDTVMPWTTAMKRILGKDQTWLDDILCSARSIDAIAPATAQIQELLRQRHHIEPGAEDDFQHSPPRGAAPGPDQDQQDAAPAAARPGRDRDGRRRDRRDERDAGVGLSAGHRDRPSGVEVGVARFLRLGTLVLLPTLTVSLALSWLLRACG